MYRGVQPHPRSKRIDAPKMDRGRAEPQPKPIKSNLSDKSHSSQLITHLASPRKIVAAAPRNSAYPHCDKTLQSLFDRSVSVWWLVRYAAAIRSKGYIVPGVPYWAHTVRGNTYTVPAPGSQPTGRVSLPLTVSHWINRVPGRGSSPRPRIDSTDVTGNGSSRRRWIESSLESIFQ